MVRCRVALYLSVACTLLTCSRCEQQEAVTDPGPSWEEMQQLYPGIERSSLSECSAEGGEGCSEPGEFNFVPRMFGEQDRFQAVDNEASSSRTGDAAGESSGDGGEGSDGREPEPWRPPGDEQYAQAAAEALHMATSKELTNFVSGTSYMTNEDDGPLFQRTFALRRRAWDHHMVFHAAMGSDAVVTAQELLPLRPGRNAPLALVLGDASGIVSLFEPTGEMLAEFDSGGGTVTVVAAFASRHNATTLITGHADGRVRTHVIELRPASYKTSSAEKSSGLEVADVRASQQTLALPEPEAAEATAEAAAEDGAAMDEFGGGGDGRGPVAAAVRHLLTLRIGREWRFAAIQRGGGIAVWREDGLRLQQGFCPRLVLAARWSEASITMVTPTGGAILLTHAMPGAPAAVVRTKECAGLGSEGHTLVAAAFDVQQPVRVYGVTPEGRLLQLSLGNAKTFQHCRVQHSVEMGVGAAATLESGASISTLQQHVIAASQAWVAVFDVSAPGAGPKRLFLDSTAVISATLRMQVPFEAPPAIATGRRGPVALGLHSGVVATYAPALLHFDDQPDFSLFEAWSRTLVTVAMLVVAAVQVARARRRARKRHTGEAGGFSGSGFGDAFQEADLQAALGVAPLAGGKVSAAGRLPTDAPLPWGRGVAFADVGAGELGDICDLDDDLDDDSGGDGVPEAVRQVLLRRRGGQ